MGNTTLVPVAEYLKTSYRPDVDYVGGELLERNMGETSHARVQRFFIALLDRMEREWRLEVLPEQRVQVAADRFRIPDVCAVESGQRLDEVLTAAPVLCVEVLSSDDSLRSLRPRIQDYADMGVKNIWVIDPWKREAYYASALGYDPVMDGILRIPGSPIEVSLAEAFARLDP